MGKNRIFFARWTPAIYWLLVSKPVSQDIQSICYCLHTGTFRLDTCDLLVAGVPISISSKYLYLYLALKVLTFFQHTRVLLSSGLVCLLKHNLKQYKFTVLSLIYYLEENKTFNILCMLGGACIGAFRETPGDTPTPRGPFSCSFWKFLGKILCWYPT